MLELIYPLAAVSLAALVEIDREDSVDAGHFRLSFLNRRFSQSTIVRFTSSGNSCCTQWPARSILCISRSEHSAGIPAAIRGGRAPSHSAVIIRQGSVSGLTPISGCSRRLRSIFRYQLLPPRKPLFSYACT